MYVSMYHWQKRRNELLSSIVHLALTTTTGVGAAPACRRWKPREFPKIGVSLRKVTLIEIHRIIQGCSTKTWKRHTAFFFESRQEGYTKTMWTYFWKIMSFVRVVQNFHHSGLFILASWRSACRSIFVSKAVRVPVPPSTQSFQLLVLQVLASTQSFQLLVLQGLTSTQSFQLLVLQVLASTQSFQLLVLEVLASTQSFQLLVLQVLASTQVISAFGTPGTREYSVISAFGTPGTESFKMTGTRESLAEYQWLVLVLWRPLFCFVYSCIVHA